MNCWALIGVPSGCQNVVTVMCWMVPSFPSDSFTFSITWLDDKVGRVIDDLKQLGQLDNTVILYTSDQGLAIGGRHGLMGKQNL